MWDLGNAVIGGRSACDASIACSKLLQEDTDPSYRDISLDQNVYVLFRERKDSAPRTLKYVLNERFTAL